MATGNNSTIATTLGFMNVEAGSLLEQAKAYRAEMDKLPTNDTRREVYEKAIQDLLEKVNRISTFVVTTSTSTR